jgi:hypothetical protein
MYKYLLLLTGGFFLLCSYFYLKEALGKYKTFEGFEDPKSMEEQTEIFYRTRANELCPPLITVIGEVAKDKENQPLDKYLKREAKGSIMFCLPYDDITTLPADIGNQMVRSARYLNKEIDVVMKKLKESLTKSCEEQKNLGEGFEDITAGLTISDKPNDKAISAATAKSEAAYEKASADIDSPDPSSITENIDNSKEPDISKKTDDPKSKDTLSKKPLDPLRELISRQRLISMFVAISSATDFPGNVASIGVRYIQLKKLLKDPDAIKSLC